MKKEFKLEYFSMGNGLSVADINRELRGDYVKVAHLTSIPNQNIFDGEDITIELHLKNIATVKLQPNAILKQIEQDIKRMFPNSKFKTKA